MEEGEEASNIIEAGRKTNEGAESRKLTINKKELEVLRRYVKVSEKRITGEQGEPDGDKLSE